MKKITILFIGLIFNLIMFSQDSALVEAIKQNVYTISIEGNSFTGSGGELLKKAIGSQQFLLVGEQHGIQEVGEFSKTLFLEAHTSGFNHFAIETSPFMATRLEKMAKTDPESYKAFCQKFPFGVPFYNHQEDFRILNDILNASKTDGNVFWGIDQVFAAEPRLLFDRLAEIAPNEKAKKIAEDYLEKGNQGAAHFLQTQDQSKTLLATLSPKDFEILNSAFSPEEGSEIDLMLKGIQKTQEIYGAWFAGKYYDNNLIRSKLMKKQFLDYYRKAESEGEKPKVVFKFGAGHMYKGLSIFNMYDIGNLAQEIAAMNESSSLHIEFTGLKGKAAGGLGPAQSFNSIEDLDPHLKAAIEDKIDGKEWILVDMRPLRHNLRRKALAPIRDIVFGFDILIMVPEAKAVTDF